MKFKIFLYFWGVFGPWRRSVASYTTDERSKNGQKERWRLNLEEINLQIKSSSEKFRRLQRLTILTPFWEGTVDMEGTCAKGRMETAAWIVREKTRAGDIGALGVWLHAIVHADIRNEWTDPLFVVPSLTVDGRDPFNPSPEGERKARRVLK